MSPLTDLLGPLVGKGVRAFLGAVAITRERSRSSRPSIVCSRRSIAASRLRRPAPACALASQRIER